MEQPEVEKLVGELELGVDRLRSLYEQYFMGIEKLEPTVPRKDVDRRIHILRKEQIRNTALRFRFQMLVQRYNTYQSHWQRICREIENGTYKRHMMRARQRFEGGRSTPPPALTQPEGAAAAPAVGPPAAPLGFPEPGASLPADLAAELADLEREFGPVMPVGAQVRPVAPAAPKPGPLPPRPAPPAAAVMAPPPVAPPRARPLGGPPPPPAASRAPTPAPGSPASPPRAPIPPPNPAHAPAAAPARVPLSPATPLAAKPAQPTPAPTPKPAARPADPSLPEDRVRALYSQYVDAKRRQNESTAAITYEAVAKSLRDSSAKLREKHGKYVDFEVTVRDGKAILRPVIK